MRSKWKRILLVWLFLLIFVPALLLVLKERSRASCLKPDTCLSGEFRRQELHPEVYDRICKLAGDSGKFGEILTASMLNGGFAPREVSSDSEPYLKYKPEEFYQLQSCYEAIWADIACFPIPSDEITYEDSWLSKRSYGGERFHEGTDLFGRVEAPGYYPVISMTDGVVEQKGWLPLGGYRIGIRSAHNGYFYYAHLSEYEKEFKTGDTVMAGDILGYMGNTGYGEEGTVGQFPVHLHLGIYIQTPFQEELSVNPYWVLRAMEKKNKKVYILMRNF